MEKKLLAGGIKIIGQSCPFSRGDALTSGSHKFLRQDYNSQICPNKVNKGLPVPVTDNHNVAPETSAAQVSIFSLAFAFIVVHSSSVRAETAFIVSTAQARNPSGGISNP